MERGIHALIINAYEQHNGKGLEMYDSFKKLLISLLGNSSILIEKFAEDLSEYVFDWEYDVLNEQSKTIAKRFDKVDIVFLIGDCKTLPWDTKVNDLTLFLHMCYFVKKPVVALGSGAFHCLYTLCTKGARFNILNGPYGNTLDRLPAYISYSIGSENHPSGWLDNETGDIYCYDIRRQSWAPRCCVGINRLPTHGMPASDTLKQPVKKYARNDRRLNEQADVQALDSGEDIIQVRNIAQKHFLMHKIQSPKFPLCLPSGWVINTDGGLPSNADIFVLADGTHGPVILTFENCLLLAVEIKMGNTYNVIRQIVKNFVRNIVSRYEGENAKDACAMRFMDKLFGPGGRGGAQLELVQNEKRVLAPSLSSSIVPSTLATGPKRVHSMYSPRSAPQTDVVVQPGAGDNFDYNALLSPRLHSTLGKKVPVAQKKESIVRTKRLDIFLASQGHIDMQPLNKKAALLAHEMKGLSGDGFESSVHRIFDERMLRPPVPRQIETFEDMHQKHPPAIRFDRPTTANGRWLGGVDKKAISDSKTDHLYGKYGIDYRNEPGGISGIENSRQGRASTPEVTSKSKAELQQSFLPRNHPVRKTHIPELVDRKGNKIGPSSIKAPNAMNDNDIVPKQVVTLKIGSSQPFSNHRKYEQIRKEDATEDPHAPYEGTYTQPYRSEHENYIHEYTLSKQKFLAGPFQSYFGRASQIPLRSEGQVGAVKSLEHFRDAVKEKLEKKWKNV